MHSITTTSAGIRLLRVTGTSKSAEGYAARITFQRAKEEGMDVAIHWQNADSSSAKAVREIFPKDVVHPGRAHRKILEKRQILPLKHVEMISP